MIENHNSLTCRVTKVNGSTLYHADCFDVFPLIPDKSVQLILADLPYGITSNKWDSILPLKELWKNYWRVLKDGGVIALTASQPFSSALVMSQPEYFRHEWIWIKNRGGNFANTVREPFKEHEQILIFSKGKWIYNKQMQARTGAGLDRVKYDLNWNSKSENYREFEGRSEQRVGELRVPSSWQKFNVDTSKLHPTIKPIDLFKYLIKTYSNENDMVLDNTMGSGTTCLAAKELNRKFIGIEKESKYYEIACQRCGF